MRPPRTSELVPTFGRLLLLAALGVGCTPTCPQVCRHMVNECDLGGSMTELECEETCKLQHTLYHDEWQDEQKQDAFDEQLSCITASSCEELEAGACYDEQIWSY